MALYDYRAATPNSIDFHDTRTDAHFVTWVKCIMVNWRVRSCRLKH